MTKNYIVMKSDVVDTLVSTSTDTPLSANQGRVLDSKLTHGNAVPTAAGAAGNLYVKMPDPYPAGYVQIGTAEELVAFSNRVNAGETSLKGLLTSDIDMSGVTFTPIGKDDSHKYSGTFNGYGHIISNLTTSNANAGLFGSGSGATVTGVGCVGFSISATSCAGALFAYPLQSNISDCYARDCTVSGYIVGGLAGQLFHTNITGCFAYNNTVTVTSSSNAKGGLAGYSLTYVNVRDCAVYGGTLGNVVVGVGSATVTNCYSSASTGVTSEVFHTRGFWDGTGVSGTTYLSWDFANTWQWDSTNSLPALKPIIVITDTSLYAHNGTGWARLPESVTQEQVTGLTSALAGKQDALPVASSTGTYVLKCINGVLTWVSE